MRTQRFRGAESRIEMQEAKWTAEGIVKDQIGSSILGRRAYVSCQRYVSILESVRLAVNRGGTTGLEFYPPLTESEDFVESGFFVFVNTQKKQEVQICIHLWKK